MTQKRHYGAYTSRYYAPYTCKELDMTERLNQTELSTQQPHYGAYNLRKP